MCSKRVCSKCCVYVGGVNVYLSHKLNCLLFLFSYDTSVNNLYVVLCNDLKNIQQVVNGVTVTK